MTMAVLPRRGAGPATPPEGYPKSARLDAVAHRAEARIGLRPCRSWRRAKEVQRGARAKAQPLHQVDIGTGVDLLGGRHQLMGLLAAQPNQLRFGDADLLEARHGAKDR